MTYAPKDKIDLCRISNSAAEISQNAHAAYWSDQSREYLSEVVHSEFRVLAAKLGYRVERIRADEPAETEDAA